MTATKIPAPRRAQPAHKHAIALLKAGHEAVIQLFTDHEKTRSAPKKTSLVTGICTMQSVNAQIEE